MVQYILIHVFHTIGYIVMYSLYVFITYCVQMLSFSALGLRGEPHPCPRAPQLPALRPALGADGGHRGGVGIG